jgi:hypothetical protein
LTPKSRLIPPEALEYPVVVGQLQEEPRQLEPNVAARQHVRAFAPALLELGSDRLIGWE